jgi:triosephosphate isomerase
VKIPVVVGNWKMHKTPSESYEYIDQLKKHIIPGRSHVMLAVPFIDICASVASAKGSSIQIGAQNVHDKDCGAYTGEISTQMLESAEASFVLLGHSERRLYFGETDEIVHRKLAKVLTSSLTPIVCFGESLLDRERSQEKEVILAQLRAALGGLSGDQVSKIYLAYEPVWAIGTGKVATPDIAEEVHSIVREYLADTFSQAVAGRVKILYGGSVKSEHMASLMAQRNIDGVLVGGACLDPQVFSKLINY